MKLLTEMTEAQRAALEIYLEVDADYKAPPFSVIAERLNERGFASSKSSVQRWSKECDFEDYLERHINALVLADEEKNRELLDAAGAENLKKTLMTLEENAELLHGSHGVLKLLVEQVSGRARAGRHISKDDAKLMIQLYNITSAREDRLHDRQAALGAIDKLTKAELLKQFAGTSVDIEALAKDEEFTDLEIED